MNQSAADGNSVWNFHMYGIRNAVETLAEISIKLFLPQKNSPVPVCFSACGHSVFGKLLHFEGI